MPTWLDIARPPGRSDFNFVRLNRVPWFETRMSVRAASRPSQAKIYNFPHIEHPHSMQ